MGKVALKWRAVRGVAVRLEVHVGWSRQ
eukprot:SAG31_NODE_32562_length_354_cov_0.807843_1_plen_27_part_01